MLLGLFLALNTTAQYVGSQACKPCHPAIYERWKKTRMANVVQNPKEHPDAILGDFTNPDPLVTFSKDDIAFTYGSKWKQRYFGRSGDTYFVFPAQWDVTHHVWRPYFVKPGTDWWEPFYPKEQSARPTGPLCDGCHSVNYNIEKNSVTEWNVGCERCHGPGGPHTTRARAGSIVNPSRLDYVRANDVCMQCHSQGRPVQNPINGKYYDWAVGFTAGGQLRDRWRLEENKLGETSFTHFADGSAHKNRMQGNDFVTSAMYSHGVTCFSCHDPHGTSYDADLIRPGNELCLTCHGPQSPNGPRGTLAEHTHHLSTSPGGACIACHMPKIAQTIADVNVRSHSFRFIPPHDTIAYKIPNACNECHQDRSPQWAEEKLRGWPEYSPWRLQAAK